MTVWVIEKCFCPSETERLVTEVERQGGKVIKLDPYKTENGPPKSLLGKYVKGPVIFRGSVEYLTWIKETNWIEGALFTKGNLTFGNLAAY